MGQLLGMMSELAGLGSVTELVANEEAVETRRKPLQIRAEPKNEPAEAG